MKYVINIVQTYHKKAIIDIPDFESKENTMLRIREYIENNGGYDTVIDQGGDVDFVYTNERPTPENEQIYECIN